MPTASGSIAYLGAARFQGFWNATTNHSTGSGLQDAASGSFHALFKTGSSTGGGYSSHVPGLTASAGDYWQVSASGGHNVEGHTAWRLNDWVVYSGSAGGTGKWLKLSYDDTIASVIVGDLSGTDTFHFTGSANKHVLFISGTVDGSIIQSGSDSFVFNHLNEHGGAGGGRVGIGTKTPLNVLQVDHTGADSDNGIMIVRSDSSTSDGDLLGGVGFDSTDGNVPSSVLEASAFIAAYAAENHGDSDKGADLAFGTSTINDDDDTSSNEHVRILDSGKVGIGTASPSNILQVDHTGADGDDGIMIVRADSSTVDTNLLGGIGFDSTDGNVPSTITEASAFIAAYAAENHGTTDKGADLVLGTTTINDDDDTTSHEWVRILDSGEVGIGIATPTEKLEVSGAIKIHGSNALQFMTTEANVRGYIAASEDDPHLDIATSAGESIAFRDGGLAGTVNMIIMGDGKIGIGSAANTPKYTLGVTGTFGTSGDVTLGDTGSDITTVTGRLTGSRGMNVPDDMKLRFGDTTGGDAHIRYAETGNDHLIISGSSTGLVLSGSQVVISGDKEAHWQRHTVQVTGAMNVQYLTGSKGMTIPDDQKLRFGSAVGGDVTIEYDEDGTDELRFAGSAITFEQDVTFDNNVTLGVAAGDVSTVTGQLTASRGMIVPDDMKLRFGAGSGDAHIHYAETGNDHLIISGSATGVVVSGSQIVVAGDKSSNWWRHTVQVTGAMNVQHFTASMGIGIPDDKKLRFGNAMGGDVSIKYDESGTDTLLVEGGNVAIVDDKKLYFGSGKDASIEYDEDGTDELRFAGAAATFEQDVTFDNNVTLGVAAGDVITSTGQLTASRGMVVPDDRQLRFGSATGGDAHIRYAETGIDHLIISGSATGLTLSGSKLYLDAKTVASGAIEGSGSYLGLNSAGYVVLTTSSAGGSGTVTALNNKAESRLLTYGSTTTELDGEANLTYDGTTFTINDDTMIKDDHKLHFGSNSDAHIRYAETGINHLIISGSAAGTVLSGSRVIISADQHQLFSRDAVQVSGAMNVQYLTGSKGMMIPDNQKLRFGSAAGGDVTLQYDEASTDTLLIEGGNVAVADDKKLYFGTGKDASIEYDEDGTDELRFAGAAATFEQDVTFDNDVVLGVAAGDVTTVTGKLTASRGLLISDDMKLRFGAGAGDATFEYDEDGNDVLLYAGANMRISDDVQLQFGAAADATIKYAETGNDHLIISGSSTGLVLSGSQVVISGDKSAHWQRHTVQVTGAMNIQYLTGSKGMTIPDDQKLRFGSAAGGDAHIEFDENGDDYMIISGSAKGLALSGTLVGINGKVGVGTNTPRTAFTVVNDYNTVTFENQISDGQGGGEILKYSPGADDDLTVGQLYYLHTDGTWNQTDADAIATGGSQLLGIGLGNARSVGVLIKGFVRIPSTEILNLPGSGACDGLPVYVSTTAGHLDFTPPSGTDDFVRIVGYAIDDHGSDVLIYFDPDGTWVEVA